GLLDGSRLPEPIFTQSTKAPRGQHDEPMTFAEVVAAVGAETAEQLRQITLDVYARGCALAAERGIIIADTKIELGYASDRGSGSPGQAPGAGSSAGALVLADELLTSDSSRFWPADLWQPGRPQFSFDKQYVRDWAAGTGWDKQPPAPEVPEEIVEATRARYIEAYER